MTKDEKIKQIEILKKKAAEIKKEADYYNALQLALKLVLNGSYGAFATSYFILYNNHVAGTITAQGRDLTKTMDKVNEDYWYNQWQDDFELHFKLGVKDVTKITKSEPVSIYADTDSLFVSFKPAIDHCTWKDLIFNNDYLSSINDKFIILTNDETKTNNPNCLGVATNLSELGELIKNDYDLVLIDGNYIKDRGLNKMIDSGVFTSEIRWNWNSEQDFIQGLDHFRYGGYFKKCLEDYAASFGVENKEDFELERISESMINIAKKKYICHITYEDGIPFERLNYIYPKGVELVRSSTPAFARDKIVHIVKYLFSHPDTFNIKDLLKLVKGLRKEFELADIDDICMQSSVSKYEIKVLDDSKLPLQFVSGAHFAVKSAAHHNYLLLKSKDYQQKYEFIKSGNKIKYYCCKDKSITDMFAYTRGSYPIEFAPEIDYDEQFAKSILSPINSIIEPLGMPEITKRLSVVMDIFSGMGGKGDF
jgi:DNA polymerase elongation subunit (family B)